MADLKELNAKIEDRRQWLYIALSMTKNYPDSDIVLISQELDKLIAKYYYVASDCTIEN